MNLYKILDKGIKVVTETSNPLNRNNTLMFGSINTTSKPQVPTSEFPNLIEGPDAMEREDPPLQ